MAVLHEVKETTALTVWVWAIISLWVIEASQPDLNLFFEFLPLHLYAIGWYLAYGIIFGFSIDMLSKILKIPQRERGTFSGILYIIITSALIPLGILWVRDHIPLKEGLIFFIGIFLLTWFVIRFSLSRRLRIPWHLLVVGYNFIFLCGLSIVRGNLAVFISPGHLLRLSLFIIIIYAFYYLVRKLNAGEWERKFQALHGRYLLLILAAGLLGIIVAENNLYRLNTFYIRSHSAPSIKRLKKNALCSPNVIIVLADALRADRLGCYGYLAGTTPMVDSFACEAKVYNRAYAQAPYTRCSVATMFSALYPFQHGVREYGGSFLSDSVETLAEVLASEGYKTVAFVASNPKVSSWSGLDQGFEEFYYHDCWLYKKYHLNIWLQRRALYLDAQRLTNRAIDWLSRQKEEPYFLYIHYMDIHTYDRAVWHPTRKMEGFSYGKDESSRYDNDVLLFDYEFGKLHRYLRSGGNYDNTLIVLVGDHGQSLGEHGKFGHGSSLYEHQIHVPFIMKLPGNCVTQSRDSSLVGLIDIPAIVDSICLLQPEIRDSLQKMSAHWPIRDRSKGLFSELNVKDYLVTAIIKDTWKLISVIIDKDEEAGYRLYNIKNDPSESTNLFKEDDSEPEELFKLLESYNKSVAENRALKDKHTPKISAQELQRLRALGYIQ